MVCEMLCRIMDFAGLISQKLLGFFIFMILMRMIVFLLETFTMYCIGYIYVCFDILCFLLV